MPAIVLLGAQWGDEGKGKATDLLGGSVDYVVRYQGGNNAGHTVVIDPGVLLEEMDLLEARGISCERLLVSADAHLIMPHHRALDRVVERYRGTARIGTSGRGIGPAYGD